MGQPNILWICTDQQRFDTLGCCGNRFVRTPNLDRLAESGVLFDSAFAQSPVCTPSRASFLTGRYPRTTRCRQNGQSLPADEVLVTRLLAEAGYVCGLSGKLHLSACQPAAAPVAERRIDDGYSIFHWSHHPAPPGPKDNWPGNQYDLWLRERGAAFAWDDFPGTPHVKTGMPAELHQTTWCAEKAIDFVGQCADYGRPWLFSVNPFDPHHPFDPPAEYLERYLDRIDEIPLPNYVEGELTDKPLFQRIDHQGAYGGSRGYHGSADMTEREHRLVRAAYWAMCDLIDEQIGRIFDALDRTGQRDSTIVIFTSDHGEMLGDHGIYLKGPYFYDPAVRVPLILSWPGGIPGGRRSGALVELVDLAPTLLDAAGLPRHPGMQGRSLMDLLRGRADPHRHRDDVYCESYNAHVRYEPKAFATMVRTRRHKLVAVHGMEAGELYDLREDPGEIRNLWSDPAAADVKLALLKRLCDRMAETVDPLPRRPAVW